MTDEHWQIMGNFSHINIMCYFQSMLERDANDSTIFKKTSGFRICGNPQ